MKNTRIKKLLAMVITSSICLTALAGCGSSSDSKAPAEESAPSESAESETPSSDVKVKIGVSMSTTQNLFYSKMAQIIQDYCKEKGVECMVTDENNDVNKQISSFENFISSGCTAIMAVAFDPDGISDMAKKATESGIYVMTYDGIVDGAEGSLNLDNYVYGYQTGKMAADWINANPDLKAQEVIEVGVFDYPDIPLIIDRAKGIVDALTELAPNAKVVAQQKAGVGDEGNIQAENFLAAHPDIQVICGINDTGVLGAYEVFKAQGKEGDNYGFFGADGDPQALQLISDDTMYRGTVMSGAYDALPGAIDILIAASQGEEVDGTIIYETTPVTIDNVGDYLEEE
ncbi:sugar ABC transporter substrate-binding protein [Ruminococcus gauvreauii]|uniref:Sugar ABC transporter substrate-binding protein n=1 Tax=Ruminococcus gauvreauii TaxID=438033 RepID=A0ABY5VLP1_9FIRM|nr:sugar ABC transporter substrate-binding protein [Ruminococcus gauvreauii]UWP61106.1 sugar ABC transporter substrate-binding protein [Ruminococcus gauvreauii]